MMDILKALQTGSYAFFVTFGFVTSAVTVLFVLGLIAWVFRRIGGRDDGAGKDT